MTASESVATISLSKPALVKLVVPVEGADPKEVLIDVYAARRMLEQAAKQPSEEDRYRTIMQWIAQQCQVPVLSLAENMALEFNDMVTAVVIQLNSVRSKKSESIASSLTSIPESQTTLPPGQTTNLKSGSPISQESLPTSTTSVAP